MKVKAPKYGVHYNRVFGWAEWLSCDSIKPDYCGVFDSLWWHGGWCEA
jgi:hypothetical protein